MEILARCQIQVTSQGCLKYIVEEDRSSSENEEEEEEDDNEEGEESGDGEEEEEEEEGEDDDDEEEEKKLPDPPKVPKYVSIMNTLRDVNKDLDSIGFDVEKVHTKFSPSRSRLNISFKQDQGSNTKITGPARNYHPPTHEEERRRSFSPRKQDLP